MQTGKVVAMSEVPNLRELPRPTFNRVIVEPLADEPDGVIYIPDAIREKPTQGKIVAVGPGRITPEGMRVPQEFAIGQTVIFNRYAGTEVKFNRRPLIVISEEEIICWL